MQVKKIIKLLEDIDFTDADGEGYNDPRIAHAIKLLKDKKPVFESSNLFVTPIETDFLGIFLQGVTSKEHANIYMAVQMTINYINSKE